MAIRRRKFRVSLPGGAIVFSSVNGELTEVIPSWVFMPETAEEDPGAGNIRLDTEDPTAATEAYISATEGNGADLGELLEALAFGVLVIRSAISPEAYHIFRVGAVTGNDGDTWYTVALTELLGGPHIDPYEEGEVIAVGFAIAGPPSGDAGDLGITPFGSIGSTNVQDALEEIVSELLAAIAAVAATVEPEVSRLIAQFTPLHNQPPASNFATLDTRNGHPVLDFDTTTQEEARFGAFMPDTYDGSDIKVTLYSMLTSATSGTLGYVGGFENMSGTDLDSDSFASNKTFTAATVPGTSGQVMQHTVTFSASEIDGLVAGDPFRFRVLRDVANDDAADDAELVGVKIEMV